MADAVLSLLGDRLDLFWRDGADVDFTVEFATTIASWSDFVAVAKDRATGELITITVDTTDQASDVLVLVLEDAAVTTGSRWEFSGLDPDGKERPITYGWCYVRPKLEAPSG
jgi:hypothetical protein